MRLLQRTPATVGRTLTDMGNTETESTRALKRRPFDIVY
jgi:hypothetical protein